MSAAAGAPKRCSLCGAAFTCGARADSCWCQALPPLPRSAVAVEADCRCPDCLAQLVAASAPAEAAAAP